MESYEIHKRINFNFDKQKLVFDTSLKLFSHAFVDEGTKELLNSLRKNSKLDYSRILDLGCGYGPIGIFLKKAYPKSEVTLVDRDFLAVEFTKRNAELNEVKIESFPSIDFSNVKGNFSLILTNFPAKLEKEGLKKFIFESSNHLEKNGIFAIVVVKELSDSFEEILKEVNENEEKIKVIFSSKSKHYSIFHLSFNEKFSSDYNYVNNNFDFKLDNRRYSLSTTNSLEEFDEPHFVTEMIAELASEKYFNKSLTLLNSGQGFLPIFVEHFFKPSKILIFSDDLLAQEFCKRNLEENNFKNFKIIQSALEEKSNFLLWSLKEESFEEIESRFSVYKSQFSSIILGGRITLVQRFLTKAKIKPKRILKNGKYCAVELLSS